MLSIHWTKLTQLFVNTLKSLLFKKELQFSGTLERKLNYNLITASSAVTVPIVTLRYGC